MNQKQCKALRKVLGYHPHEPKREYVSILAAYRIKPNYGIDADGKVSIKYEDVPMYQTVLNDKERKLYKSLKKKYINPDCNKAVEYDFDNYISEDDNE